MSAAVKGYYDGPEVVIMLAAVKGYFDGTQIVLSEKLKQFKEINCITVEELK